MRLEDFDYHLPTERIAQSPADRRDGSRLLVCERGSERLEHRRFEEIVSLLPKGALLCLNDTRVVPARLRARKASGGAVELLLLDPAVVPTDGLYRCMARSSKPLRPGARLTLEATSGIDVEIIERTGEQATIRFHGLDSPLLELLQQIGEIPLPPYIERSSPPGTPDRERYQTVYAQAPGAIAAPTAGLHFTAALLDRLRAAGHPVVTLTLHVGPGTFAPIRTEDPRDHVMHAERFEIPEPTAMAIAQAKREGRPVLAVGTTVVRALESQTTGYTRAFIYPGHHFGSIDGMLTNFHLPRSTLLMLVSALVGRERLLSLYREAIAKGYRFYSYGDAMLVLP